MQSNAQPGNPLPYQEIPVAPQEYTAAAMASRMIDGLGFRYFWASKDLSEQDLKFKASEDARTCRETLVHIMNLSYSVVNTSLQAPQNYPEDLSTLTLDDLRSITLNNLNLASETMKHLNDSQLATLKVMFANGRETEYPYWNMLNGPLADAIYHTGQIVMLRRASGNPIADGVSVFTGTRRK